MAKIRSLKGEYFRNAGISRGGIVAKVLGAGLITAVADDEGRFKAEPDYLRGEIFTHDSVTAEEVKYGLEKLHAIDFIRLYSVHGRVFGCITMWKEHQPVPPSRFKESKLPPPPNTKRRRHVPAAPQAQRKQPPTLASSRAGVGSDRKEDRIGEHGDAVGGGASSNGAGVQQAIEPAVVPVDRQVSALCEWLLDRRGWQTFGSMEATKRERGLAAHILELGTPFPTLVSSLDAMWEATDPDDRPSTLGYFWTRLQDEQHAALKQQRSHVSSNELSKPDVAAVVAKKRAATQ